MFSFEFLSVSRLVIFHPIMEEYMYLYNFILLLCISGKTKTKTIEIYCSTGLVTHLGCETGDI